ncbi:hypothetical protein EDD16DRAFT_1524082 [Pisolithus croceorrhizus]|nr:hypothetical protein EDD16DRAFT_1524082 [Pisolithus croceorrhizus]
MFVKNSLALQDAVNCILTIFEMLIVNSGGLEEAEKLEQWRNAVRGIRQELESVRSIANRTDNVPHLLIGMDKYICWTENLSMPGIPFPDWHNALFPPLKSIAGHPWLLTVEWRYDVGLLVQPPAPATEAEALMLSTAPSRPQSTLTMSTVPCMAPKGSIGHIPTRSTPLGKGKGVDPSEKKGAKVAMVEAVLIPLEDDNGDMSEHKGAERGIASEEEVPHKATPKTTPSNPTTPRHQNTSHPPKPAHEITPAEEEDSPSPLPNKKPWLSKGGQAEALLSSNIALVLHPPTDTCINYPVPPPLWPDSSAYVPLPAPPMPPTSARSSPVEISPPQPAPFDNTLLSVHQRLDNIIRHQDQMMGQIDEGEQQMAEDNSTQTPHVDTDMTGTTSNIIELQDENVRSPSSKSASQKVMPTCGEPPAIDQGVELLATESSDNGRQADQGEAANIVEATAVAGEAQPVVTAEGGIGGEHHQMMEENSGECPTKGDGATTILASEQQVGEVSAIISEEELGSTGGKLAED